MTIFVLGKEIQKIPRHHQTNSQPITRGKTNKVNNQHKQQQIGKTDPSKTGGRTHALWRCRYLNVLWYKLMKFLSALFISWWKEHLTVVNFDIHILLLRHIISYCRQMCILRYTISTKTGKYKMPSQCNNLYSIFSYFYIPFSR